MYLPVLTCLLIPLLTYSLTETVLIWSSLRLCVDVGSRAVRLAFSDVTRHLYYSDWLTGTINVIDVQQSGTSPRQIVTGLNNPLPIAAHPQHKYDTLLGICYNNSIIIIIIRNSANDVMF